MTGRRMVLFLTLLLVCVQASPVAAGISPYVRLEHGGNGLRMTKPNEMIPQEQADLRAFGYPADFKKIGPAYGLGGSAGVWLFPALRVGVTYAYQKAVLKNRLHVPGEIFYAHDAEFRVREIGAEAALRFRRLGGLTVGGNVAQCRAQMVEGITDEEIGGQYYFDATAERTRMSYGAFVGIDQTNPDGVAGFVRAGFTFRDMSYMPSSWSASDGINTDSGTGKSVWLDFSGFYVKAGIGFDLVR